MDKDNPKPTYKQYFHTLPDEDLLKKVLLCFNFEKISENYTISKQHQSVEKVLFNFHQIIPDLTLYYRPHIMHNFFYNTPLTFTNCTTMLRNILIYFDYKLKHTQIVCKKKKYTYYTMHSLKDLNGLTSVSIKIYRSKPTLVTF